MLNEAILSAAVQCGITGAGLVLAVYALVIPISRKMLTYRAKILRKQMQYFEKQRKNLTPEATKEEFKRLQRRADFIKETKTFPRYLSIGVAFAFSAYLLLAIFAYATLRDPIYFAYEYDMVILFLFVVANFSFLAVGLLTIFDISTTMQKDYERIKKRLEQD